ncbi:2-nitropropane dioxygenase [Candidatus Falkowbacteria bacterium CG10_big_fil_rev_8_21_14_0_10_43_10]|uniref:2-nitropropane dioxygenase n=1 Tax=Candidatus Falkowbacteria bacterium CG10_big_fil_rev_8_21_14_0_10_43_10 TaxID=1974567 RepID=A0A2H0V278_9BACT|nr:MAG: 2-nitropropane dioxygenase [Candidatus Falkowbacteria bacterium CG10_big_fil_rev_8_21_14_0_10_43_10]
MALPRIIQGGMGAGVSSWRLARAVSMLGHLGVVSGVALDTILIRRLQLGDLDGHIKRALDHFPNQNIAQRIYEQYFIAGGKSYAAPFKRASLWSLCPSMELQQLTVVANFVEAWLAKEGHKGIVGINYLEKIQLPNLASIYGAMLAGVDYVLMGAGIPWEIPGILDIFVNHDKSSLKVNVAGADKGDDFSMSFNPREVIGEISDKLRCPYFLAIIASNTLALSLKKKSNGKVDGFVIEGPTAGGHNAPPRGEMILSENGEPIYGEKDVVDLEKIKSLGLPFWLAGSYANRLEEALKEGAAGIQVGTPFAFCEESGLSPDLKRRALELIRAGKARVYTDSKASPTGFPFKVLLLGDTISDEVVYKQRSRICDLGYLRTVFKREDGSAGYRCPSQPVDVFLAKSGNLQDAGGHKCLCNALLSNIGLEQIQAIGYREKPLITSGADFSFVAGLLADLTDNNIEYTAADVIKRIEKYF